MAGVVAIGEDYSDDCEYEKGTGYKFKCRSTVQAPQEFRNYEQSRSETYERDADGSRGQLS